MPNSNKEKHDRFAGRVDTGGRICAAPHCREAGEFRAPAWTGQRSSWDGPGVYSYLCLTHIREFNAGYDFFDGMDSEQIYEAQHPISGWDSSTRRWVDGADPSPRWQDFSDPLDAIGARFRENISQQAKQSKSPPINANERHALEILGLDASADKKAIRRAYSNKLRAFHPDRNGGDRSHEKKLQQVLEAWSLLRKSENFS